MNHKRICIYPKDIQLITGRSERYGRKLIQDIREYLGKESHQFITTEEFSDYTGISVDVVNRFIQN